MKKIIKFLTIVIPVVFGVSLIIGCTNIKSDNNIISNTESTIYFQRGVYKSSSSDNSYIDFYIFDDANSGHTEDSENGIGLPFSCVQSNDNVKFRFGGVEEPEETFTIKFKDNQTLTGSFKDGKLLTFEPVPNANPDNFDALEYISINKLRGARSIDGVVEPVYTQDCFPKTLQQSGVTKKCFEYANLGKDSFCSKSEIKMIKEYYKRGQDKDPLNDGSGQFCAD